VVASRLPITVLTGPVDDLKVQLAHFLIKTSTSTYVVVSDEATSALIAPEGLEKFNVDGCLCCIGAVTLMAQLTRLLRTQRREKKYQNILLVAGAQTKSAALLDLLRQPLLADLVVVSSVIFACSKILMNQAEDIVAADVVYYGSQLISDEPSTPATWLTDLPGSDDRVFVSDMALLKDGPLAVNNTEDRTVWPAEMTFDRQNLQNLFDQAAKDGLRFDAVFHTQRAWYRWRVIGNAQPVAPLQETTYRRHSYLHWHSSQESLAAFRALTAAIAFPD
jgi:hypothetical protein